MLLRARDNNIQSFAYTWLYKGNQNEFLKHPKINSFKLIRKKRKLIRKLRKSNKLKLSPPSNHLIFGCLRNLF